jgi:ribonuclease HI
MIQVYCDGACSGNPGPGGWAFVIPSLGIEKSGYQDATTNNRMELTAVIEALSYLSSTNDRTYNNREVEVITDSQYVVKSMTENWRKLKNTDLWSALAYLCSLGWKITWTWIKGHASNPYNIRCDELAVKEYTQKMSTNTSKTIYEQLKDLPVEDFAKWLYINLDRLNLCFGKTSGNNDEMKLLEWLKGFAN